jgi:hypothetical protein
MSLNKRALAMESKRASAAVSATKEKSILSDHRIERAEVGAPGEFYHLSDNELLTVIRERLLNWSAICRLRSATDRSRSLAAAMTSDLEAM